MGATVSEMWCLAAPGGILTAQEQDLLKLHYLPVPDVQGRHQGCVGHGDVLRREVPAGLGCFVHSSGGRKAGRGKIRKSHGSSKQAKDCDTRLGHGISEE